MKKYFLVIIFLLVIVFKASAQSAIDDVTYCSQAQHDHPTYGMTAGPDGEQYATWMPQFDHRYSCHYGHEHGTNPAVLFPSGWRPPFGVASTAAAGQPMFHEGYKGVGFYSGDYAWYITIHQGSTGQGATCTRYHDFGVYVENYLTGERMAEIYYMADFGYAARNTDGAPLTPLNCPDQAQGVPNNGTRLFGVVGDPNFVNYNPWRVAKGQNAAGFNADHLTVWVDSIKLPYDLQVSQWVENPNGMGGTNRPVQTYQGMGFVNPPTMGEFCTDAYAAAVIDCTEPNAVHQYINPSVTDLRPELAGQKCHQRSPYDQLYMCGSNAFDPWAWSDYNILNGIGDSN